MRTDSGACSCRKKISVRNWSGPIDSRASDPAKSSRKSRFASGASGLGGDVP